MTSSSSFRTFALAIVVALGACKKTTDPTVIIETAPVERRSIVLSAQANDHPDARRSWQQPEGG
jgi:hypothetical protein